MTVSAPRIYVWVWAATALCGVVAGSRAVAGDLPVITSYSQTRFGVYRGDTINLKVTTKSDRPDPKWVWIGGKTFCRSFDCQVETDDLSLGTHRAVFVALNKAGSRYLRYTIRVLNPPADYEPGTVTPPLVVKESESEALSDDVFRVQSRKGRGFSYNEKKVQVVGPVARRLGFAEKLRSQPQSILEWEKPGAQEHFLAGASATRLARTRSGRRAIRLLYGTVRSRNLGETAHESSVLIGSWLQVDPGPTGDYIVSTDENRQTAQVTVLRGAVRVFVRRKEGEGNAFTGKAHALPAGVAAQFTRGKTSAPEFVDADPAELQSFIRNTSPQYVWAPSQTEEASDEVESNEAEGKPATLIGNDGEELPASSGASEEDPDPIQIQTQETDSVDAAIGEAKKALRDGDPFVASAYLKPHSDAIGGSYKGRLALAQALMQLYQDDVALRVLEKAKTLKPKAGRPWYLEGRMHLRAGRLKPARKAFAEAADREGVSKHQLDYYRGVIAAKSEESLGTRGYMTYAVWDDPDGPLADSARTFLAKEKGQRWLRLRLRLGALHDSNPLRVNEDVTPPEGITAKAGAAYEGVLAGTVWPYRGDAAALWFGGGVSLLRWANPGLEKLGQLSQRVRGGFDLEFGGSASRSPWLDVRLAGELETLQLGEKRALDTASTTLTLRAPRLAGAHISGSSHLHSDPLPARNDGWDPTLKQAVAPSDRTNREVRMEAGLIPWKTSRWSLGADVLHGRIDYQQKYVRFQRYRETGLKTSLTYTPHPRTSAGFGLKGLKRSFPDELLDRDETVYGAHLEWTWNFTPFVGQMVSAGMDSADSTQDDASYSRLTARYLLTVDL